MYIFGAADIFGGRIANCFSDISTLLIGPKQDTLIKLYQKDLVQLLRYGIYMQMLMILTLLKLTRALAYN